MSIIWIQKCQCVGYTKSVSVKRLCYNFAFVTKELVISGENIIGVCRKAFK